MSSYTMELRNYIEMWSQDEILSTRDVIEKGRTKLFDFQYPIFDPDYKKVFETHFIRKFYMREIGFETEGLFKFHLETWLLINMPYFNKLFESELLNYDPLTNTKTDVTHNKTNDRTQNDDRDISQNTIGKDTAHSDSTATTDSTDTTNMTKDKDSVNTVDRTDTTNSTLTVDRDKTGNETDDNFNRKIESDMPDSRLNLTTNDGEGVLEYASRINEDNTNNSKDTTQSENGTDTTIGTDRATGTVSVAENDHVNGTVRTDGTDTNTVDSVIDKINDVTKTDNLISEINETEDYVESRVGKVGNDSYSKLVQDYRGALLRIENQIFEEMQQLFMLVY